MISKKYQIKDNKVIRKKTCPRCGAGVFLAEHKDRLTCGKCGYTEFIKKAQNK
ncbi:MAG: 30S ribosomal protein S27ae [Methanomicrobia archaeon]|jgi:small subunit ribosomal protein S27Ae|nr:30S ribosomal protein S27ae [Methanomicrobia archaeon]RLF94249.1 MAG: 30S ribosomal protein S27ae [Thermococci archaeon]RLF95106.1 MAG: 30S ribosomal protein S27ae [Thermococci archaeon]HDN81740.1 30S ribosomal protein S27ae [Methanomicrobia archaeon]HEC95676.1 30S ribosomal protein S27ae [Euryarchaeota archaeon]